MQVLSDVPPFDLAIRAISLQWDPSVALAMKSLRRLSGEMRTAVIQACSCVGVHFSSGNSALLCQ